MASLKQRVIKLVDRHYPDNWREDDLGSKVYLDVGSGYIIHLNDETDEVKIKKRGLINQITLYSGWVPFDKLEYQLQHGIKTESTIPSFSQFCEGLDREDIKVQREMWESIIDSVLRQLPAEYRGWHYVGPMPPTGAPLHSKKISEQPKKARLFFSKYGKHTKHPRIEVTIYRMGRHEWKVGSISVN